MIEVVKRFLSSLCPPCCTNCPDVFILRDGTIVITDDFNGEIRISKKQLKKLVAKYRRDKKRNTLEKDLFFIEDGRGGKIKITKEQLDILNKKYKEIVKATP